MHTTETTTAPRHALHLTDAEVRLLALGTETLLDANPDAPEAASLDAKAERLLNVVREQDPTEEVLLIIPIASAEGADPVTVVAVNPLPFTFHEVRQGAEVVVIAGHGLARYEWAEEAIAAAIGFAGWGSIAPHLK